MNDKKEWLVWSNEHQAWWGPNRCGYYTDLAAAGLYTEKEADDICLRARTPTKEMPIPEEKVLLSLVKGGALIIGLRKELEDTKALVSKLQGKIQRQAIQTNGCVDCTWPDKVKALQENLKTAAETIDILSGEMGALRLALADGTSNWKITHTNFLLAEGDLAKCQKEFGELRQKSLDLYKRLVEAQSKKEA